MHFIENEQLTTIVFFTLRVLNSYTAGHFLIAKYLLEQLVVGFVGFGHEKQDFVQKYFNLREIFETAGHFASEDFA